MKRFLEHAGTPKSFGEIEAGLKEGGYPTTSKNLVGMIRPVVYKAERTGNGSDDSIIKIDGRWGLKAWRKNEKSGKPKADSISGKEHRIGLGRKALRPRSSKDEQASHESLDVSSNLVGATNFGGVTKVDKVRS